MAEKTSVAVKRDTWRELNGRRTEPNETLDDVIQRLLDEAPQEAEA